MNAFHQIIEALLRSESALIRRLREIVTILDPL